MPTVVITGASSGIGYGTALTFAEHGYNLCVTGRNEEALQRLQGECVEKGLGKEQVHYVLGDITSKETAQEVVKQTIEKFGGINILVNNAGITVRGQLHNSPLEDFDHITDVNVRSVIQLTQLTLPHIIASKGTIVNVSSIAGLHAYPGIGYYCMTKAAVDAYTKCLALELAPLGVRVNSVNPSVVLTNIHKGTKTPEEFAAFLENSKRTHALGRPGEVHEIAKAIYFLAGPDSTWTTGIHLKIDGGRGIMPPRWNG